MHRSTSQNSAVLLTLSVTLIAGALGAFGGQCFVNAGNKKSSGQPTGYIVNVTVKAGQPPQSVTVEAGQRLRVRIPAHTGTLYRWTLDGITGDAAARHERNAQEAIPHPNGSSWVGYSEFFVDYVLAVKPGTCTLTWAYRHIATNKLGKLHPEKVQLHITVVPDKPSCSPQP